MLCTASGPFASSVSTYTTSIVTHSATATASAVGRSRRTRTRVMLKPSPPVKGMREEGQILICRGDEGTGNREQE